MDDTIITINDIIKKYEISRATLNRFIKKNNIKPFKNVGRINYYEEKYFIEINNRKENKNQKSNVSKKENDTINDYIILLKEQIQVKDNQIKELQKIIDQQQKLTLLNVNNKKEVLIEDKKGRKFFKFNYFRKKK